MTDALFPFEFFIEQTPKSQQASASSRNAWGRTIRSAAHVRIAETVDWTLLDDRAVAVTIYYFAPTLTEGDIDNIIKPILDGMKHVIYPDDAVVERVLAQRFEPNTLRRVGAVSDKLAEALDRAPPVIYVRVEDDLSWRMIR